MVAVDKFLNYLPFDIEADETKYTVVSENAALLNDIAKSAALTVGAVYATILTSDEVFRSGPVDGVSVAASGAMEVSKRIFTGPFLRAVGVQALAMIFYYAVVRRLFLVVTPSTAHAIRAGTDAGSGSA